MQRLRNWDCQATLWAIEQVGKPFVWGETDCVSLLITMLGVMYGPCLDEYRYASLVDALDMHEATGGARAVLTTLNASPLDLIAYANTGDVLISPPRDDEPFDAVMPVITDKYLFTEPHGLVRFLPLAAAPVDAIAYRVPHVL